MPLMFAIVAGQDDQELCQIFSMWRKLVDSVATVEEQTVQGRSVWERVNVVHTDCHGSFRSCFGTYRLALSLRSFCLLLSFLTLFLAIGRSLGRGA